MAESIWKATLEEFRNRLATRDPVPAGVATAAVSASLALSLVIKVLEITSHRKDFQGDPEKIDEWLFAARAESAKLVHCADDDIVAFAEYMASRKSPEESAALHRAIQVPLVAARAAASGLQLSAEAAGIAPASLAPDLGTATRLLQSALLGILLSVESNAQRVSEPRFQDEVNREIAKLRQLAKNHQHW